MPVVFVSNGQERREHYGCGDFFAAAFYFCHLGRNEGTGLTEKEKLPESGLTEQEKKLLGILRGIDYGELRVVVQAGKPVRVEEIRKSVQL